MPYATSASVGAEVLFKSVPANYVPWVNQNNVFEPKPVTTSFTSFISDIPVLGAVRNAIRERSLKLITSGTYVTWDTDCAEDVEIGQVMIDFVIPTRSLSSFSLYRFNQGSIITIASDASWAMIMHYQNSWPFTNRVSYGLYLGTDAGSAYARGIRFECNCTSGCYLAAESISTDLRVYRLKGVNLTGRY